MTGESLKQAAEMLRHEHSRWNKWALGFFGAMVGVLFLMEKYPEQIPWRAGCIACAIISLMWLTSALAIRRSTHLWWDVLCTEAANEDENAFQAFHRLGKGRGTLNSFADLLGCVFPYDFRKHRREWTIFSVTANLVRAGFWLTILFGYMAVAGEDAFKFLKDAHEAIN